MEKITHWSTIGCVAGLAISGVAWFGWMPGSFKTVGGIIMFGCALVYLVAVTSQGHRSRAEAEKRARDSDQKPTQ